MKTVFLILAAVFLFCSCSNKEIETTYANGQMPTIIRDNSGNLHLVFGDGDTILYSHSSDGGENFSSPQIISILPKLAASHMRGPQIATSPNGLIVTACTDDGNIFSYSKNADNSWSQALRVNDVDTIAKENLMSLGADGSLAFAVWLDLRDGHNKIFGAKSIDGGKSWSKNILIYASPDSTVCECCKPSVLVRGDKVFVMFRNLLNGNRDLHLVESADGGNSFGQALKLGNGSWKLDGCPMDGGGLTMSSTGALATVWNREGKIYSCEPGKDEVKVGEGKNCTMELVSNKKVYAWIEAGEVVVMKPDGTKIKLGKGQLPQLRMINERKVLCVWERDKQVHRAAVAL